MSSCMDPACGLDGYTCAPCLAHRTIYGYQKECHEVEQTLGKVLGYPWYKDDPKNFPDATEADGVCIGEHVPGTLAQEAAQRIRKLEEERDYWRGYVLFVDDCFDAQEMYEEDCGRTRPDD